MLEHYGLTHVKIRPHCPGGERDHGAVESNGAGSLGGRRAWRADTRPRRRWVGSSTGTTTSGCTAAWATCGRSTTTAATRQSLHEARRKKLAAARHRRREKNLELRQPTLPLKDDQPVANFRPRNVSLPVKQIMNPNRTNRLALMLVIVGFILVAGYMGGYFKLARRSLSGDGCFYVDFDTEWLCTLYYPAVWADATMHRRPIMLCYPTAPCARECTIVNEH